MLPEACRPAQASRAVINEWQVMSRNATAGANGRFATDGLLVCQWPQAASPSSSKRAPRAVTEECAGASIGPTRTVALPHRVQLRSRVSCLATRAAGEFGPAISPAMDDFDIYGDLQQPGAPPASQHKPASTAATPPTATPAPAAHGVASAVLAFQDAEVKRVRGACDGLLQFELLKLC